MYILGLALLGETSACLIKDGEPIAAAEEERFTRNKHSDAFPYNAIRFCLDQAGISVEEIDYLGINYNPVLGLNWLLYIISTLPRSLSFIESRLNSKVNNVLSAKRKIALSFNQKPRFKYFKLDHHLLHAASCFYVSPFNRAAILSIDAMGEWRTTLLAEGYGNQISVIKDVSFPHSLGFLYGAVTDYLGFDFGDGEGKVMGLAPYGKPAFCNDFKKIIILLPEGKFKINLDYFDYQFNWHHRPLVSRLFLNIFGLPRKKDEPIEQKHMDIAASLQAILEVAALHLANELFRKTKSENLCLAGGVALNCAMNSKILKETSFKNIFVQPAANDAGTALGACYYIYHGLLNKPRNFQMSHAYWGPGYKEQDYEDALKKKNLRYTRSSNICKDAAMLISQGKVGGWFQGRMEFGPRALGSRSVIADPRRKEMKEIINEKIKLREPFRPFAPSVLEDKCREYFKLDAESPFMLLVADAKQKEKIPAVVHVDGTSRVQTVNKNVNLRYWSLIKEFESLTGIPIILNTSFNGKDEPIVCSPEDAIRCFLNTELDFLCLGDYLLEKEINA